MRKSLRYLPVFSTILACVLFSTPALAVDIAIGAEETYERVQKNDKNVLFLDVRDPVEIMFIGFTDVVHANVPYILVDRTRWDEKRGVFKLVQNPDFIKRVRLELTRRGLTDQAEIVTMCRSGSERGEPSAAFLRANGFPNARYVVNGFQGAALKDGPKKGMRLQNGWQNLGLPWSMKMNPSKMYRVEQP